MLRLTGYDDFGKRIDFDISQIRDFSWKRRYVCIQTEEEVEVIDPDTIESTEVLALREQISVLQIELVKKDSI